MDKLLMVGLGGFLGSALRFGVAGGIGRIKGAWGFPIETLVINVTGCLLIGFLAGIVESRELLSAPFRAFLFIGVLGGYTTFSTFGYETFHLIRGGQIGFAAMSAALQLVLGLAGVWAGDALSRAI